MKAQLVTATWICCMTMVVSISSLNPTLVQESDKAQRLRYNTITLDLQDPTTEGYSRFLTALRAAVNGEVTCGMPTTRSKAKDSERFVLAELKVSSTISVTLALDVLDLYVMGYLDKLNGKDRGNIFKDAPKVAKDNLFKGAIARTIPYGSRYQDLEKAGGQDRGDVQLGLNSLKSAAKAVFGQDKVSQKVEGKFFLVAVQMVSEATRFRYIEEEICKLQPYESAKPDPKALELENSWNPISVAVLASKPKCEDLKPEQKLKDPNNRDWIVKKVKDIAPVMGILKNKASTVTMFQSFLSSY